MFHFFHRTPEIVLDCFTTNPSVYYNTPIVKTIKTIPDWWKELDSYKLELYVDSDPTTNKNMLTAKDCYAIKIGRAHV